MNLKNKLILIILFLIVLPIVVFRLISDLVIKDIFVKDKINSVNVVLDQNFKNAQNLIEQYKDITLLTSLYPPIQGLIRVQKTGVDPVDGSTEEDWKKRLRSIFTSQLKTIDAAYQIRYIDQTGQEIVKVDSSQGEIYVHKEDELQNKQKRYYFHETAALNRSEVYVSPVDLNVEHGVIQQPHLPTIRFATKVVSDEDGTFKGIIIINFEAGAIFENLETAVVEDTFVIDESGYFLSHKDRSKLFGVQLETGVNYFSEQPEFEENSKNNDAKVFYDEQEKEYRIWKKFYYREGDLNHYWIVIDRFHDYWILDLFESWNRIFNVIIFVFVFLIGFFAWFLADSIINPIIVMSRTAEKGEVFEIGVELKKRQDEIGRLARSMEKMGSRMEESALILDQKVQEKTKELQKNMAELESFNHAMVGREMRMLELKKEVNGLSRKLGLEPPYDLGDYHA